MPTTSFTHNQGLGRVKLRFDMSDMTRSFLRDLPNAVYMGASQGVNRAAQYVLSVADKYVPQDSGKLRASGRAEQTDAGTGRFFTSYADKKFTRSDATVSITYGNSNTPYAVYVHEDENAAHGEAYNRKHGYKRLFTGRGRNIRYTGVVKDVNAVRRPEEQAKWMEKAMSESEPTIKLFMSEAISDSILRVRKNPARYGLPTGGIAGMSNFSSRTNPFGDFQELSI